jgi:hypothetical protein
MPPSGFNPAACAGLLTFVRENYQVVQHVMKNGTVSYEQAVERVLDSIHRALMLGFETPAADGLIAFLRSNFDDLHREVTDGKHKDVERAVAYELDNIGKALLKLHIDKDGNLTVREIPS